MAIVQANWESYDQRSEYNTSTYKFQPQVTGHYAIGGCFTFSSAVGVDGNGHAIGWLGVRLRSSADMGTPLFTWYEMPNINGYPRINFMTVIELSSGTDYYLEVATDSTNTLVAGGTVTHAFWERLG